MFLKSPVCSSNFVALLAEGVDRNITLTYDDDHVPTSPSSRRAWIEISMTECHLSSMTVALLAEGVDRNLYDYGKPDILRDVALLAEGVDRNILGRDPECRGKVSPSSRRAWIEILGYSSGLLPSTGRPPRGGRG